MIIWEVLKFEEDPSSTIINRRGKNIIKCGNNGNDEIYCTKKMIHKSKGAINIKMHKC